jgi:hypothetical protein
MRKIFLLMGLFTVLMAGQASAQQKQGGDPAAMLQRMKERIKPELVEKTKITEEQADKVVEISFNLQRQRREVRMDQNLSEEEKTKRNADIDASRDKQFLSVGLTADQVTAVNAFFEEQRKQQAERRKNGQ